MQSEPTNLWELPASELIAGYRGRTISPVEVVESCLQRIDRLNSLVHSFVAVDREAAIKQAMASEARIVAGDSAPLLGVPIAVKDLIDTAGLSTTYGSAIFRHYIPTRDAVCVAAVRRAGAIILGKTATHEFAWGFTTDNPHFGVARNPWDLSRTTGGSSGGSASAVACHVTPIAIGTDTGGSIRLPASFCGVTGFKPTFGCIDPTGVFPLAPSLDHIGPLSRTADDAHTLWQVLAGAGDRTQPLQKAEWRGIRVGVGLDCGQAKPEETVADAFHAMLKSIADAGGQIIDLGSMALPDIAKTFVPIQLAEALHVHTCANLLPQHEQQYGADVRARIDMARRVSLAEYLAAEQLRRDLVRGMQQVFRSIDVVVSLCSSGVAPHIEELRASPDMRQRVLGYTAMQNLTGLPACTVRIGFDADGLPVGIQITGRPGDDRRVLGLAQELQSWNPDIQDCRPELCA